ncbi:MAG: ypdA 2 [Bacteroidetes bacterium]|jgi:hypothetical protein|nr:ypdA 2 [Bacteroidota bacterium]
MQKKVSVFYVLLTTLLFSGVLPCFSQTDSNTVITFNFNDHTFNERNNLLQARASDVYLTEDRFGNERSAAFIQGSLHSYLNLGTSPLLKAKNTTISIWANLSRRVYLGKGYDCNPIYVTRNCRGWDFDVAYYIGFDGYNKRFTANSTKDSTEETAILSIKEAEFDKWYHFVLTSDNTHFAFYINGELQGRIPKGFETRFLEGDSVTIGHSASLKNERFAQGAFDDIQIFHRVLSEKEILDLYNAPNPNKTAKTIHTILIAVAIGGGILVIALLLLWQRRRALKREQQRLAILSKMHEMEIRTLKAQMNPHFIFNSLNSIQHFILLNDNENALTYLGKFSKLIRQLLESNANEILTLEEEVGILKGYLEIESLRFQLLFGYTITIDEKLFPADISIPHLMIQPFIENAIWHGLLPKKGEREIIVCFEYIDTKVIKCSVDDNGVGREESRKRENTFKRKSLALSYVKQRLELMNKSLQVECGITIIDKKDTEGNSTGTRVELILPIIKSEYVESGDH